MDNFADIRPFLDHEANKAVAELLADRAFIVAMRKLYLPKISSGFDFLLLPAFRLNLTRLLRSTHSCDDFQLRMSQHLSYMIHTTTEGFTFSGLEYLNPETNYLFISNHRDITLDAAFLSHILFHQFGKTPRIAIGNNLHSVKFASHLFRLNKCFTVKRVISSPRKHLAHLQSLSSYIQFCLNNDHHSVWIAQKQGRAKDGVDKTDPAIIKMLAINKPTQLDFATFIENLQIVPVAISYEYDPCDSIKARELHEKASNGHYLKAQDEDFFSMGMGILGQKGKVHLSINKPLNGQYPNAEAVAREIDQAIIRSYQLHSSNYLAFKYLEGTNAKLPPTISKHSQRRFNKRLGNIPQPLQKHWLQMYANPVYSKMYIEQKD